MNFYLPKSVALCSVLSYEKVCMRCATEILPCSVLSLIKFVFYSCFLLVWISAYGGTLSSIMQLCCSDKY